MLEMCFVFTLWSVKGSYKDRAKGVGAERENRPQTRCSRGPTLEGESRGPVPSNVSAPPDCESLEHLYLSVTAFHLLYRFQCCEALL